VSATFFCIGDCKVKELMSELLISHQQKVDAGRCGWNKTTERYFFSRDRLHKNWLSWRGRYAYCSNSGLKSSWLKFGLDPRVPLIHPSGLLVDSWNYYRTVATRDMSREKFVFFSELLLAGAVVDYKSVFMVGIACYGSSELCWDVPSFERFVRFLRPYNYSLNGGSCV
jgi:hypothetical protein